MNHVGAQEGEVLLGNIQRNIRSIDRLNPNSVHGELVHGMWALEKFRVNAGELGRSTAWEIPETITGSKIFNMLCEEC